MSTVAVWLLVVVAVLVVVAGLISSVEAALSSFSRARAEEVAQDGKPGAARLLRVVEDPARFMNTALFLRLLMEIAAIVLATVVMTDLLVSRDPVSESVVGRWWSVAATVLVMVAVSFVVIGVAPRTVGRQHAERVALLSSGPLIVLTRLFGPLAQLLILVGNALTPGRGFSEGPFASEAELRELVDLAEASSVIESGEREMIHSVFELGDTLAREVMVPRTDMVCIEMEKVGRQAVSLFLRSGFSRIPVVGEGSDDIRGLLYFKDVARRLNDDPQSAELPVEHFMRPMPYVPESKPVDDLLREMQRDQTHFAVVIDEYGGTAGLVTIEDILEEIVGEIADEYDREAPGIEDLGDGRWRVPASLHVDDLRDEFDVDLEEEDVDTVGGLIAKTLGVVPILGSHCEVAGLSLTADKMSGRRHRIASVIVERLPEIDVPEPARGRESRRDAADQSHREREGAT